MYVANRPVKLTIIAYLLLSTGNMKDSSLNYKICENQLPRNILRNGI